MRPPSLSSAPVTVNKPGARGAPAVVWPLPAFGVVPLLAVLPAPPVSVLVPVPGPVAGMFPCPSLPGTVPRLPCVRLLRLPALTPSACMPVCSILPPWLRNAAAAICKRCALSVPPRLSTSAAVLTCKVPRALTTPALAMPPLAAICVSCCDCSAPLFSRRPSTVTTSSPACAPRLPALRTPTPCSLPINQILLANMPPSAPTSSANVGAAPLTACAVI